MKFKHAPKRDFKRSRLMARAEPDKRPDGLLKVNITQIKLCIFLGWLMRANPKPELKYRGLVRGGYHASSYLAQLRLLDKHGDHPGHLTKEYFMRIAIIAALAFGLSLSSAAAESGGKPDTATIPKAVNTICPVSGESVDVSIAPVAVKTKDGRTVNVGVCCAKCPAVIKKNPDLCADAAAENKKCEGLKPEDMKHENKKVEGNKIDDRSK
ncbi:MAG: hypothetical protein AAB263_16710 [Planctomycetota bacterium]